MQIEPRTLDYESNTQALSHEGNQSMKALVLYSSIILKTVQSYSPQFSTFESNRIPDWLNYFIVKPIRRCVTLKLRKSLRARLGKFLRMVGKYRSR